MGTGLGVGHNNQYNLDGDPWILLILESWPVAPESSHPVCSITSLFAATDGERRFEAAFKEIARRAKTAPEVLRSKDRRWDISTKRAEAVALMVREYGYGASEVAKYLGRDQANVSTMLSRLSARQTARSS